MTGRERRRHVRVRPCADYEILADLVDGFIVTPLQVVDVSIGGLGLIADGVGDLVPGRELHLRLTIHRGPTVELQASVRHVSLAFGLCGVEFLNPPEPVTVVLRRAVSTLLERGSVA